MQTVQNFVSRTGVFVLSAPRFISALQQACNTCFTSGIKAHMSIMLPWHRTFPHVPSFSRFQRGFEGPGKNKPNHKPNQFYSSGHTKALRRGSFSSLICHVFVCFKDLPAPKIIWLCHSDDIQMTVQKIFDHTF